MVSLNAANVKSEDDISGNNRPLPGRYHAVVNAAAEKASKKKGTMGLEMEFQVLAGTTPGQEGRTIPLFLAYEGADESKTRKCLERVTRVALCSGILQPGESKEVDWDDAIGREMVIEIDNQEYETTGGEKRQGAQVSYLGFWSLGNQAVADVPKDSDSPGMMALRNGGKSNGNGNGVTKATGTTTAAKEPAMAGAGAGRSKYADL